MLGTQQQECQLVYSFLLDARYERVSQNLAQFVILTPIYNFLKRLIQKSALHDATMFWLVLMTTLFWVLRNKIVKRL